MLNNRGKQRAMWVGGWVDGWIKQLIWFKSLLLCSAVQWGIAANALSFLCFCASPRLCGIRGLQPYTERLFLLSSTATVVMTSEVSLTGPGLQLHYTVFNLSDRKMEARNLENRKWGWTPMQWSDVWTECVCVLVCFVLQHALGSFSAPPMGCVFLHVMESRTVQMVLMRGTVVFMY